MRTRIFGTSGLLVGALFLVCGAAFGASQAGQAVPAGEPVVPGATYASGLGAPYLTTKGAPRKLAGAGIGAIGGKMGQAAAKAALPPGENDLEIETDLAHGRR